MRNSRANLRSRLEKACRLEMSRPSMSPSLPRDSGSAEGCPATPRDSRDRGPSRETAEETKSRRRRLLRRETFITIVTRSRKQFRETG